MLGRVLLRLSPRFVGAGTSVACLSVSDPFGVESELGIPPPLRSPRD